MPQSQVDKEQGEDKIFKGVPGGVMPNGGGGRPRSNTTGSNRIVAGAYMPPSAPPQTLITQKQSATSTHSQNVAQGTSGIFGRKKNWADQMAEDELFAQGTLHSIAPMTLSNRGPLLPTHHNPQHRHSYVLPSNSHQQILQHAGNMSKPPSPVDAANSANQVKFVNSTVENLQNQIRKEEAPKKKRTRTSPEQLRILQKVFSTDPMPSSAARLALSKKLGMPARAVQVWFQNRRAKAKRTDSLGASNSNQEDCDDDDDDHSQSISDVDNHHENLNILPPNGIRHGHHVSGKPSNRAASVPMGCASDISGFYNEQLGQNILGMDTSFFEPIENVSAYDSELVHSVGLDFSGNNGLPAGPYGGFYGGYGVPMQGMFSLPPNPYENGNVSVDSNAQAPVARSYGYGSYHNGSGSVYASVTDDINQPGLAGLNGNADEGSLLGPINPLSALLDVNGNLDCSGFSLDSSALNMFHYQQQPNPEQLPYSSAIPIPSSRRSYSLNDIHAQLTTQQIQTLENIGLPSLGRLPNPPPNSSVSGTTTGKSALGPIKEEEGPSVANDSLVLGFHPGQDALITPIDDLRMSAFWENAGIPEENN